MNVYIDANFILEEALEQELSAGVSESLVLIEKGRHSLRCPVVAFVEVITRASNRHGWRVHLKRELEQHQSIQEFTRSGLHVDAHRKVKDVVDYLMKLQPEEEQRVGTILGRILDKGELLSISIRTFVNAATLQRKYALSLSDALIAASILIDIVDSAEAVDKCPPSLFITGDKQLLGVREEFKPFNCSFVSLTGAAARLRHTKNQEKP